jgi:hypothetical protein
MSWHHDWVPRRHNEPASELPAQARPFTTPCMLVAHDASANIGRQRRNWTWSHEQRSGMRSEDRFDISHTHDRVMFYFSKFGVI